MPTLLSNRQKTASLKGLAILAVLVNHYLNAYVSRDYAGYANGIIALFFILSGYGLFFSLAKTPSLDRQSLTHFYGRRFLRIYPLFWLALLGAALFQQKSFSIATILAFPLHQASGIYWFISSLMQCYLVAPFLHLLLRTRGLSAYLQIVLAGAAGLQILFFALGLPYAADYFVYRDFFLGHLLLFALGLCLPAVLEKFPGRPRLHAPLLAVSLLFFCGGVWATQPHGPVTAQDALLIAPYFILAGPLLVYALLRAPLLRVAGIGVLTTLGDASYALYLFHLFYYALLAKAGLLQPASAASALITLALLPALVFLCALLEKGSCRLAAHLEARWLP
jgi:peptidoglycan/LPS O-acetylase OafA/YrhL